ncbi:MAG: ABC transporter ATP-binding protein [Candidatus Kariarchaeaceae archaeon]|jgi:ABC-type branched-subunit amino acid transport system ATPase component
MTENTIILQANQVSKYFGGVKALQNVTIAVEKGKLTSLIGPNGSGKSTFYNVITGYLQYDEKEANIRFKLQNIEDDEPESIARLGMVRTFQHTRNFPQMTVLENMLVSPQNQVGESIIWAFLGKRLWKKQEVKYIKKAIAILEFLEIDHVADHLADELSGGQQKLLAIGRLLMTQPSLLLLDEPVAGVNPTLANKIFDRIISLRDTKGIDIFLIEHNMDVIMAFSDEIYVLADGQVIAQGPPGEIQKNRQVLDAYLGESPDQA